ncbi:hypothetical protein C1645_881899 [Glomus cerebriforme]|uniref:Uncharacterized protein n=1 Tax=Glomus cerebriforme TaxID=658196 RepID=A0A397S3B9_9GLOM|nr:hypothetical protein C1645_881899 [Glomus cerebriforme]
MEGILPQEPIAADKMIIISAILFQQSDSINLSELLFLFETTFCFIKELSIKNNNILILDFINQWLKLARYNITSIDILKKFSLKHIVTFYELIEEKAANSVIQNIDDKFKISLTQQMKDSINNIMDYYDLEDQQLIPAKTFVLALKRFIYRFLLVDSNIDNLNLNVFFLDFTLDLWPNYIEKELIEKLFPTCLLVSHVYDCYNFIVNEIEKATNERQNNKNFELPRPRKIFIKKFKKIID